MLAARIHEDGGPDVLRVEEVPDPIAGPGEVLSRLGKRSRVIRFRSLARAEARA